MPEPTTTPTRAERRRQTVRDLVAAAEREILAVGIERASIRGICKSAGYTLGAFYSNFGSKDDLVMAVADAFFDEIHALLSAVLATSREKGPDEADAAVRAVLAGMEENTRLTAFALECSLHSRHNPEFGRRFHAHRRRLHAFLVEILNVFLSLRGRSSRIPPERLIAGIMALWLGQALAGWSVPSREAGDGTVVAGPPSIDGDNAPLLPVFMDAMLVDNKGDSPGTGERAAQAGAVPADGGKEEL